MIINKFYRNKNKNIYKNKIKARLSRVNFFPLR